MDFVIRAQNIRKSFGATAAVKDTSFPVQSGKITALLGGNGAGKSTLTKILSGTLAPDAGALWFGGQSVDFEHYSPTRAKHLGIRVVYQELSLCTNLTANENVLLEYGNALRSWRHDAHQLLKSTFNAIFPGHLLRSSVETGTLRLAVRQMIEIARAAADPRLKLLILDEPTSSLDAFQAHHLFNYLRQRAAAGLSVIFIGHRLDEILEIAEEFMVMRDGNLVWTGSRPEATEQKLIELLSAAPDQTEPRFSLHAEASRSDRPALVEIGMKWHSEPAPMLLRRGEIVGLAGLEGSGQQRLLRTIFRAGHSTIDSVRRSGQVAYVTGDRQKEGVFGLWTTMLNMTAAWQARQWPLATVSQAKERKLAEPWRRRFTFTDSALDKSILDLSGGNQQKALLSRALIVDADTILLDDPTRGVDVGVKAQVYETLRAQSEKLVVWYSSEDSEFLQCSRVLIFRRGRVIKELQGLTATRENLNAAIFGADQTPGKKSSAEDRRRLNVPGWSVPLGVLALVLLIIGILNQKALTPFGMGLLLNSAMPLALVSLGQMFVVARSEIDLGVGGFAGLTNVICATLLVQQPIVGLCSLMAGLACYALLGWIIHSRRIPAIVATLGSSFIWLGAGYKLQPTPGGSAPEWLSGFFNLTVPVVPLPLLILIGCALLGMMITRSRFGIVLRAFGNNERAVSQLGWSAGKYHVLTYVVSGLFGLAAGLCLTGVNASSDVNAAAGYTLLSVAAVVMGGCDLVGGRIEPIGVVLAAVTLSLLGALLGFLQLSSDYIAAVQGLILLGIVVMRTIWKR